MHVSAYSAVTLSCGQHTASACYGYFFATLYLWKCGPKTDIGLICVQVSRTTQIKEGQLHVS